MDSRLRGNDDIRLADDIHGVAKLKWYNLPPSKGEGTFFNIQMTIYDSLMTFTA